MRFSRTARATMGGLLLCGASLAGANPLTWQLSGATFDDGTSASGTLRYDAATDALLSFSIAVQDGALPAFTYTAATSSNTCMQIAKGNDPSTGCNTNLAPNELFLGSSDESHSLALFLSSALTDAGGAVDLLTAGNSQSYETAPVDGDYGYRLLSAGSLIAVQDSAVPEPGSLALMGLAAAGMFGVARLRAQRKQ